MSKAFRVNKLDTKTKNWLSADSVSASSIVEAVSTVLKACANLYPGKRVRRTKEGLSIKSAGVKIIVSEDHSVVHKG